MTKVVVLYVVLLALLALLDAIAISSLRSILNDFLIGARNRKSARCRSSGLFSGDIITCPTICVFACILYAVWYTKQIPLIFPNCNKRTS